MIWRVGNDDLDRVWPKALGFLGPALNGADPEKVKEFIRSGNYQLWMTDKCACTTAINDFPIGKVMTVVHLGGKGLEEWMFEGMSVLESWGRQQSCDRIRINGRDEWSRVLPGFRKTSVVSEKVIS